MKKILHLSCLATTLSILTACGSGGSNSSPSQASGKEFENPLSKPSIEYVAEEYKASVKYHKEVIIRDQNNKIISTFTLADLPKGKYKETYSSGGIQEHLKGINLVYSTSLALYSPSQYQDIAKTGNIAGLPTDPKNAPKGTITYKGSSVGLNTSGSLILHADFDNRSVTGKISDRKSDNGSKLTDITLNKGSFYNGAFHNKDKNIQLNALMFKGSTSGQFGYYTGGFAGPNAEEVVGVLLKNREADVYETFAGEMQ